MNPLYPAVADRAGHRSEYCRAPEAVFNFAFEFRIFLDYRQINVSSHLTAGEVQNLAMIEDAR